MVGLVDGGLFEPAEVCVDGDLWALPLLARWAVDYFGVLALLLLVSFFFGFLIVMIIWGNHVAEWQGTLRWKLSRIVRGGHCYLRQVHDMWRQSQKYSTSRWWIGYVRTIAIFKVQPAQLLSFIEKLMMHHLTHVTCEMEQNDQRQHVKICMRKK